MHLLANRLSFFFGIKIHLLYFFLPRSSRKNAHSSLRYFGIRGMVFTFFLRCLFADLLQKRRNTQNLSKLSFFGVILGVCFRYEQLYFGDGILTVRHSKAAVCRFRARERYSIICCTFSFCLQPLYQWQHHR